jgi:hypothetical protein
VIDELGDGQQPGQSPVHADQPDGAAPFLGAALPTDQNPQAMGIAEGQIAGVDHDPGTSGVIQELVEDTQQAGPGLMVQHPGQGEGDTRAAAQQ